MPGSKGEPLTDGVFPESKEFLAGYWIIDVETPSKLHVCCAGFRQEPGAGGKPGSMPIEVRRVMSSHSDLGLKTDLEKDDGQTPENQIEHLLRELAPQALGVVARRFRDFPLAEDAVQEALLAAFRQWPQEGIPENPRGWLIRVASRRMADAVRSEMARRRRETVMTTAESRRSSRPN